MKSATTAWKLSWNLFADRLKKTSKTDVRILEVLTSHVHCCSQSAFLQVPTKIRRPEFVSLRLLLRLGWSCSTSPWNGWLSSKQGVSGHTNTSNTRHKKNEQTCTNKFQIDSFGVILDNQPGTLEAKMSSLFRASLNKATRPAARSFSRHAKSNPIIDGLLKNNVTYITSIVGAGIVLEAAFGKVSYGLWSAANSGVRFLF